MIGGDLGREVGEDLGGLGRLFPVHLISEMASLALPGRAILMLSISAVFLPTRDLAHHLCPVLLAQPVEGVIQDRLRGLHVMPVGDGAGGMPKEQGVQVTELQASSP